MKTDIPNKERILFPTSLGCIQVGFGPEFVIISGMMEKLEIYFWNEVKKILRVICDLLISNF
jgi:hypothetical protein